MRTLALVDGEHYPSVVRAAIAELTDVVAVALLAGGEKLWLRGVTYGSTFLLAAASVLVAATLVSFDAYQLGPRERLHKHLYRVIGAVGGSGLMMLTIATFASPAAKAANILHLVDWCLKAVAIVKFFMFDAGMKYLSES